MDSLPSLCLDQKFWEPKSAPHSSWNARFRNVDLQPDKFQCWCRIPKLKSTGFHRAGLILTKKPISGLTNFVRDGKFYPNLLSAVTWKGECEPYLGNEHNHDADDQNVREVVTESDLINILEILRGEGNFRYHKQPQLKALQLPLDPDLVLKVVTNETINPHVVWKFFVWAKKQMKYKHTSETYNSMISILCDIRKFTAIFYTLEDMHEDDCSLTVDTCMKMARTFGQAGLVERSLHSFNHMARLGSPPTARHYSSLINAFLKSQHYFKAYIVYTEMVRTGCEADSYIYKLLIREFERAGVADLAMQLYSDMLVKGSEPDAETSSVLINVLCRAGRVDDALCLFEKMKMNGIRPNVSRYNILIDYLGRENKVDKALQIFDELRCRGCLPDHSTLTSLVESLRNCGREDDADRCCDYTRSDDSPQDTGEE